MDKIIRILLILFLGYLFFCYKRINVLSIVQSVPEELPEETALFEETQTAEIAEMPSAELEGNEESENRIEYDYFSGSLSVGDMVEICPGGGIYQGNLSIHVKGCEVLESDEDWLEETCFQNDSKGAVIDIDGSPVSYRYPDFVKEDGTYMQGISLLMVTLEIDNLDAELNEHGRSHFDNPYVFMADSFCLLSSKWFHYRSSDPDAFRIIKVPDYFSEAGGYSKDHPYCYVLEPGKNKEIVIGFYLDEQNHEREDLSDIYLIIYGTDTSGAQMNYLVDLGLKNEKSVSR